MANNDGKIQFEQEVFPLELSEINRRRTDLDLDIVDIQGIPSVNKGLVGLCLSGGGIRSAIFSLGIIQALSKHKLLKSVDYLSTVSGGGYTGSCISSVMNNPNTGPEADKFPFQGALGQDEPEAVSHLRNSSNYLAPVGMLDKLRIPALVLRGIISNFLLFLFWVIVAVLITEIAYELLSHYIKLEFFTLVSIVFSVFMLMVVCYPILFRLFRGRLDWNKRDRGEFWFTVIWLLSLTLVFLIPVGILINQAIDISFSEFKDRVAASILRPYESNDIWIWLGFIAVLFLFMRVGAASERITSITGKLILYAAGIIGPAILAGLYLLLVVLEVDSPIIDSCFRATLDNGEISEPLRLQLEYKDVRIPEHAKVKASHNPPGWLLQGEYSYDITPSNATDKFLKITRHIPSTLLLNQLQTTSGAGMVEDFADSLRPHGIRIADTAEIATTQAPIPKDIILLIGNSTPFGKSGNINRNAIRNSVRKILSLPVYSDTRVAVIIFDEQVHSVSKFIHVGHDSQDISKALNQVDFSGKKNNEAAGLFAALNKLEQIQRSGADKVIVLVSDGILNSGDANLDKRMSAWITGQFIETAKSKDIKIFSLVASEVADYALLQKLAHSTGGQIFPAYSADNIAAAFQNIHARLSNTTVTSKWTISEGSNRLILSSQDNGVLLESTVEVSDHTASALSGFAHRPKHVAPRSLLIQILDNAGLAINRDNAKVVPLDTANGRAWRISAPFSLSIMDKKTALAIQWKTPWLRIWDGNLDWGFLYVFIILFFYRLLVDVNATSVHSFYRDRLSRAFLFGLNDSGHIEFNDDLKLHELNKPGSAAPYHLINVALNLHGSKDPSLRGRQADFFIFSKHFTGSQRTGFSETEKMEALDNHLNLATAMAISGAAAAPNMGTTTVKQLVFLLTMLNIRLGYWLPNPRVVNDPSTFTNLILRFGVGARYLLRESLSHLDDKGNFVNVSDGGHLENLGMYELLRRRCKFIISVDGEADPNMGFKGLVKLILYARIDMGIVIDINLDAVRKNTAGISGKNWALGTIRYGDNEFGHLLYIKSSLAGDENEYIREYKSRNPDFPHESTIDQFFDETQFEAYRALGFHIGNKLFADTKALGQFSMLMDNSINAPM